MTTARESHESTRQDSPRVTVVLKTAEQDGEYIPYWPGNYGQSPAIVPVSGQRNI